MTDDIFIAIGNSVLRVRKADGTEVWRTRLQNRFSSGLITIAVEEDAIYASSKGELFRLHPDTGEILWQNGLVGLGQGPVLISAADSSPT